MTTFQQLLAEKCVACQSFCWHDIDVYVLQGIPDFGLNELAVECLSGEEQARADRYYRSQDARSMRWRRLVLRALLAERLQCGAGEIDFTTNAWGKLELSGIAGRSWVELQASKNPPPFNLSHSGDALAIAVGPVTEGGKANDWQVGVDLEREKKLADLAAMARLVMHARELAEWEALPADQQVSWFFDLWSAKEAVLKSVGYGLSVEPQTIQVEPGRSDWAVAECELSGPDGKTWIVETVLCRRFKPHALAIARARLSWANR